ncbi:MAG: hypothetical protein IK079_06640 [Desulfovibrio sp.]|nr:hypothetical protein [Desulfovibrio sp.]
MKRIQILFFIVVMALSFSQGCKKYVPIENQNVSTAHHSLKIMQEGILEGCRTSGWTAKVMSPQNIEAVLRLRSHIATVRIPFTENGYSINYKDSVNLTKDGKIHQNYEGWILRLRNNIDFSINSKAHN